MLYRIILFLVCINSLAFAQTSKSYCLNYKVDGSKISKQCFNDSSKVKIYTNKLLLSWLKEGFLEASLDSFHHLNDSLSVANFHKGKLYHWAKLNWSSKDLLFTKPKSWNKKFEAKIVSTNALSKQLEIILSQATNRGYPFAHVWLDSIQIKDEQINALLKTSRGPLINFDDITVEGEKIVSNNSFWYGILNIRQGAPFSMQNAQQIDKRIKELPFVEPSQPTEVIFKEDKASLKLFLRKKKSNHFDIIIGLQPASESSQTTQLVLTGQITANVYNLLQSGEHLLFDYKKFKAEDQNLNLAIQWPFLFKTQVGLDAQFSLQKRDTSYLDLNYGVGGSLPVSNHSMIKVFVLQAVSNILSFNKQNLLNTKKLPSILDYSRSSFGVEGNYNNLDFILNPSSGWELNLKLITGLRTIRQNPKIVSLSNDEVDFGKQYDSLGVKNAQFRIEYLINKYTKLFPRNILKTSFSGGAILGNNLPLQNELYKLGGYRILRGFDEQSVEVSRYLLSSLEYRLLIGPVSYVFLFTDIAFTQSKFASLNYNDNPISFGIGLTLETKSGVFGISTAVGQRKNSPFDWKSPKIHFGYVNIF